MAAQTIFNYVITWADGDIPSAGSQSQDSTAINGNWWKITAALNVIFNLPNLILRSAIIGKAQLKSDVCDGVTTQLNGTSGAIEIKDPTSKIPNGGLTTVMHADDSITSAKMPHDSTVRKMWYGPWMQVASQIGQADYIGVCDSAINELPILRNGCITGVVVNANGTVYSATYAYNEAGNGYVVTGNKVSVYTNDGVNWKIRINGVDKLTVVVNNGSTGPLSVLIEIENVD